MDLYGFINANSEERTPIPQKTEVLIKPSVEGTEDRTLTKVDTFESLIQERDRLITEKSELRTHIDSLEEELTRLRKGSSEFSSLLQSLRSGKEELISKIKALDEQVQSLEKEKLQLQSQLSTATSTSDRALKELEQALITKNTELEQIKKELTTLQGRIKEVEASLENAEQSIADKDFEIEQLVANNRALQETIKEYEEKIKHLSYEKESALLDIERLRKDFASYMQRTKTAFAIIFIATLVVAAVLFVYFNKGNKPQQKPNQTKVTIKGAATDSPTTHEDDVSKNKEDMTTKTKDTEKKPEEGGKILETSKLKGTDKPKAVETDKAKKNKSIEHAEPKPLRKISLSLSNMSVDVFPLQKGEIPSSMKQGAEEGKSYYLINISSNKGALSQEFAKSPSIDFVDANKERAIKKGALKIEQINKKGKGKAVNSIECLVSLSKDFQPAGFIIKHPTKRITKIVIL